MGQVVSTQKSWTTTQNTSYSLTTASQLIAAANKNRISIVIRTISTASNLAIIQHADDTGEFPLEAGDIYSDSGEGLYQGAIWAKTDAGTDTIYVWEREDT